MQFPGAPKWDSYQDFTKAVNSVDRPVHRLMIATGCQTVGDFASFMNISEASVYNAKKKGRVPRDWMGYVSMQSGIPLAVILFSPIEWLENKALCKRFTLVPVVELAARPAKKVSSDEALDARAEAMAFIERNEYNVHIVPEDLRVVAKNPADGSLMSVRVLGQSMKRSIPRDSFVLVDLSSRGVSSGNIYVVRTRQGWLLCRIMFQRDGYILSFDNDDMLDYEVGVDDIDVLGQVVHYAMKP